MIQFFIFWNFPNKKFLFHWREKKSQKNIESEKAKKNFTENGNWLCCMNGIIKLKMNAKLYVCAYARYVCIILTNAMRMAKEKWKAREEMCVICRITFTSDTVHKPLTLSLTREMRFKFMHRLISNHSHRQCLKMEWNNSHLASSHILISYHLTKWGKFSDSEGSKCR